MDDLNEHYIKQLEEKLAAAQAIIKANDAAFESLSNTPMTNALVGWDNYAKEGNDMNEPFYVIKHMPMDALITHANRMQEELKQLRPQVTELTNKLKAAEESYKYSMSGANARAREAEEKLAAAQAIFRKSIDYCSLFASRMDNATLFTNKDESEFVEELRDFIRGKYDTSALDTLLAAAKQEERERIAVFVAAQRNDIPDEMIFQYVGLNLQKP
jgi:hypothetical protein